VGRDSSSANRDSRQSRTSDGESGELKLRARAVAQDDRDLHVRYAIAVGEVLGWQPEVGAFHLFAIDIDDVTYLRYDDGDQRLTRWPPAAESVRRIQTATSVGPPELVHDLLDPEQPQPSE